jgi:hypothetical protein
MTFNKFYFKENFKKYKIFVDLDGVIVDWEKGFTELSPNKTYEEFKAEDKTSDAWRIIHKAKSDWWANLSWLPEGKELWKYIKKYNPTILSSPGKSNVEIVTKGKIEWIKRELGEDINYIIERDKHKYAKDKKTILIDDDKKKIDKWKLNGGTGILFKSTEQTIKELQKLGL